MRARAILLLCGISFLWGSGWIAAPLLAQTAAPFAANALIFTLAALASSASLLIVRFRTDQKNRQRLPLHASLLLGFIMLACPLTLLLVADSHGIGGWVPLAYALLPLLTGFVADAWSPSMVIAVGAVLVLLNGAVPIAPGKALWALLALAAVGMQAFGLRYAKQHSKRISLYGLLASLALQCALAAVLLATGSLLFDPAPRLAPLAQWTVLPIFSLLALTLLGTALSYAGLYWLLARSDLGPQQVAVTQWIQTWLP